MSIDCMLHEFIERSSSMDSSKSKYNTEKIAKQSNPIRWLHIAEFLNYLYCLKMGCLIVQ